MECGHVYYQNYNWNLGQESFKKAKELSDIQFELTGAYGKRTKFQQKDLAQLMLRVNKSNDLKRIGSNWIHYNKDLNLSMLPEVNKFKLKLI